MDDTCAVCADTLEWVAYGQCGHHEVCSTCIARLRFICNDRRCCLCKSESSIIFVTKALGNYTTMINDFSVFPADRSEGQVGPYWYDEGTQAFFDDLNHYKAIKAMCKLSCIICDNKDEQRNEGSKRRGEFRNIEQLKSHLFHRHKLFMCSLCLEGRKIFICEQKLYTRAQLNQHINTGDSVVDGSESERGGFMGHPICEFCKDPFYGENELYTHMSTEHYTCHICQRRQPGHYEYYRNYDDLEVHFGREHFLCEDEACLAKKFIVFSTESEMKRHNATEHGGHMSRSKRNAVLQIPTSFLYQRSGEQDRRGRGRGFHRDSSDSQLSMAIQASLETANAQPHASSSSAQVDLNRSETSEINLDLGVSSSAPLEESSFPPLPGAKKSSKQKSKNVKKPGKNTMAAHLRRGNQGTVTVLNSSRAWPAASHEPTSSTSSSSHLKPISNSVSVSVSSSGSASSSMNNSVTVNGFVQYNYTNSAKSSIRGTSNGLVSASSASPPNNVDGGHFGPPTSDFPPIAATQQNKSGPSSQASQNVEDVRTANKSSQNVEDVRTANKSSQNVEDVCTANKSSQNMEDVRTANKSLVKRIRAGLEFDDDKYAAFKIVSSDYRKGIIDAYEYIAYVHQFGLSRLVGELGRLCPDGQKQKELLDAYNTSLKSSSLHENGSATTTIQPKGKESSKKGKEKCEENGIGGSRVSLADSIITSLKGLQSNYNRSEVEVEVLSKDGYRSAKGKSKVPVVDELAYSKFSYQPPVELRIENNHQSADGIGGSKKDMGIGGGGNKQRKKTSKFNRVRLGDNSPSALTDHTNSDHGPDLVKSKTDEKKEGGHKGLPVRGVWQNGGGRKLVAMTQRDLTR